MILQTRLKCSANINIVGTQSCISTHCISVMLVPKFYGDVELVWYQLDPKDCLMKVFNEIVHIGW